MKNVNTLVSAHKSLMRFNFNLFNQLFEEFKLLINSNLVQIEKEHDKIISMPQNEFNEVKIEGLIDDYWKNTNFFTSSVNTCLFLMIYKDLEYRVNSILNFHSVQSNTIEIKNLKGDYFEQLKCYYKKVLKFKIPKELDRNSDFFYLSRIRNCIIHNDSLVEDDQLFEKIENRFQSKGFMIFESRVVIDDKFIQFIIHRIQEILNDLLIDFNDENINFQA